ncbi:MAG TPA: NADH-quinone oxidoreductase subunit C [Longimicrobiales bacterium]
MGKDFEAAVEGLAAGAAHGASAPPAGGGPGTGDGASHPSVNALRARFGDAILRHEVVAGDEHVVYVEPSRILEILGWLRDDPGERYDFLKDVTAVDFGGGRPLQVVYELWSIPLRRGLRVKAELPLDALEIDSVTGLWQAANWLERETYDMFGIRFRGHPDLRRILMPDSYAEGHPLRKDFPLRGRFSRAEQTRRALALGLEDIYFPEELEVGLGGRRPGAAPGGSDGGETKTDGGGS